MTCVWICLTARVAFALGGKRLALVVRVTIAVSLLTSMSAMVTAAAAHVPRALLDQLAEGARLVVPVTVHGLQHLLWLQRVGGASSMKTWDSYSLCRWSGENLRQLLYGNSLVGSGPGD